LKISNVLDVLFAISIIIFCIFIFGPSAIHKAEETSYKMWGRPDNYMGWFYPDNLNSAEQFVQKKVNKLCSDFPIPQCPEVRIFFWSILGPAYVVERQNQKPILFLRYKCIETFDNVELEAVINHEYGHLFLNTYDQTKADKFSSEIVGKEKVITALKKTRKLIPLIIAISQKSYLDNEMQKRFKALEE